MQNIKKVLPNGHQSKVKQLLYIYIYIYIYILYIYIYIDGLGILWLKKQIKSDTNMIQVMLGSAITFVKTATKCTGNWLLR